MKPVLDGMRGFFTVILLAFSFLVFCQKGEDTRLIKSIYFGGGSYYVDPYQTEELYQFIDSIPNALSYTITIHSHTDNIGGSDYNDWLSRMRSEKVSYLLQQKGYPSEAIKIKDFGMHNPVYDNNTLEGRLKNRRVDVIFWPVVM